MKPGDIVMWRDEKFGRHRFWEIQGVHLGAQDQEGLVELRNLTEKPGVVGRVAEPRVFVPEPLLRGATIYTPDIRAA